MINLKNSTILFLEDNMTFAYHTIKLLKIYAKEVIHCVSMKSAIKLFEEEEVDMIISDIKVEDGIALDFIKNIRQTDQQVPIAVLSAHRDENFLLEAIPLGLTSYSIKPLNFEQFEQMLEKCSKVLYEQKGIYKINDITEYCFHKKVIKKDGKDIELNKREAEFLELLIKNFSKVVSKETISYHIWQDEQMSDSALKNFILRFRKKIGKDILVTVSGIGYKLKVD